MRFINCFFVIILNCGRVRIIQLSFLISYFFINYFRLTFVLLLRHRY